MKMIAELAGRRWRNSRTRPCNWWIAAGKFHGLLSLRAVHRLQPSISIPETSEEPVQDPKAIKNVRIVQNEIITFEIDSESALQTSTWNT